MRITLDEFKKSIKRELEECDRTAEEWKNLVFDKETCDRLKSQSYILKRVLKLADMIEPPVTVEVMTNRQLSELLASGWGEVKSDWFVSNKWTYNDYLKDCPVDRDDVTIRKFGTEGWSRPYKEIYESVMKKS